MRRGRRFRSAVLTFEPHPREHFRPDDPPFRLTLSAERAEALEALGVTLLYELPFDHEFSQMPAESFVDRGAAPGPRRAASGVRPGLRVRPAPRRRHGVPGRARRGAGHGADPGAAARRRRRPDLGDAHPPRAAGRLSGARDRRSRPPVDHPRHGRAWRRTRADDRLSYRQHRTGPPSGAGARGLRGDDAAA